MIISENVIRKIIKENLKEFAGEEIQSANLASRLGSGGSGKGSSKNITVDSEKIVSDISEVGGVSSSVNWDNDSPNNARPGTVRKTAWAYIYPFFEEDVKLEACGFVKINDKITEQHYLTISGGSEEKYKETMSMIDSSNLSSKLNYSELGDERPDTTIKKKKMYFRFTKVAKYDESFFNQYKESDED